MPPKFSYRPSISYSVLKKLVTLGLSLFFKNRIVRFQQSIPTDRPILFCSNHQNAFLDALLIVCAVKQQPYSLARADVFNNKVLAVVLRFFRIEPIYRIRDGFSSLANNETLFESCYQLLKHNGSLIIFPEGNHGDSKRLRKLKKGTARIAIGAVKNGVSNLLIVPVGLEYSDKHAFRSNAMVSFGVPIEVNELIYKVEKVSDQVNCINEVLEKELKALMVHIADEEQKVLADWEIKFPINVSNKEMFAQNMLARIAQDGREAIPAIEVVPKEHRIRFEWNGYLNPLMWLFILPDYVLFSLLKKINDDQFIGSMKVVSILVLYPLFFGGLVLAILLFYSWEITACLILVVALSVLSRIFSTDADKK